MHSSPHLTQAVEIFNSLVSPVDVVSVESLLTTPVSQKSLCGKLDDHVFNLLLNSSSVADKARLLSVSSPHAVSWLSVVPSESLGLHMDSPVFQVAIKWWLGLFQRALHVHYAQVVHLTTLATMQLPASMA